MLDGTSSCQAAVYCSANRHLIATRLVPDGKRPFERFLLRAGVIAAVTVAVSLGLIALGVSLAEGFWKTLLITIATATLSIGGISLVYETYLRRNLIEEVLELVQLEKSLADSGVQAISKRTTVNWPDFFQGAEHIRLLPIDPLAWRADEWVHLADASLHRGFQLEVYLPNPAGTSLPLIADRLGRESVSFVPEIERVLREVEADCKTLHRRYGGRLTIFTYDGVPSYGLALVDERFIVSVPGLLRIPGAAQIIAMRFMRGQDKLMTSWVADQLDHLPSTGTHFTT
jgi:hypothetical protein